MHYQNIFVITTRKLLYQRIPVRAMLLTDDQGARATSCTEVRQEGLRAMASPLSTKILKLLAAHPNGLHAAAIAQRLRETQQKIHYHAKRLRAAGVISLDRHEETSGATAKILRLQSPAIAVRYGESRPTSKRDAVTPAEERFLAPFIAQGELRARIIVGSPDPHGPESARGRDAAYAIDLGLFLGSRVRISPGPLVMLDTEARDLRQNLIIVGGPVVNKVAERVNAKSPVRYDADRKAFRAPNGWLDGETTGFIAKFPNPFAVGKWVLWIAGKRHLGTRAAILALLLDFPTVCEKAKSDKESSWLTVDGVDADSDGTIDSVKF
jgi:DNA-binding transcriptional ArsR family regulator